IMFTLWSIIGTSWTRYKRSLAELPPLLRWLLLPVSLICLVPELLVLLCLELARRLLQIQAGLLPRILELEPSQRRQALNSLRGTWRCSPEERESWLYRLRTPTRLPSVKQGTSWVQ